jgi:hypothetical protein
VKEQTVSTISHDLARQWLEYFGAAVAQKLDLGTLGAIKKWIDEGRAPPLHANLPADPPTTPAHQGHTS